MPCQCELNSQLKTLQARINLLEDDVASHYQGISQLVQGLMANPLTAGSAALSSIFYNGNPFTFKLLRSLFQALIPAEIQKTLRMLNMISANTLMTALDNVEDTLESAAMGVINALANDVNGILSAEIANIIAIQQQIDALDGTFTLAKTILNGTITVPNSYQNMIDSKTLAMNEAYNAFNDATQDLTGKFTKAEIDQLHLVYLRSELNLAMLQSGINTALSSINGLFEPSQELNSELQRNAALQDINQALSFLTSQTNIQTCSSANLNIGQK